MSRILLVNKDIRGPIPEEVQWWRHVLSPNDNGIMWTLRIGVGEFMSPFKPWAWDIEYYDQRNDWSFPYAYKMWEGRSKRVFKPFESPKFVLDVLDILPPGIQPWSDLVLPNWHWEAITDWGVHEHPGTVSLPRTHKWT
jgi:hypothetical protein